MIYWHLQWHEFTHRFIASFFWILTILCIQLPLPIALHGLTTVLIYLTYRDICRGVKSKPLALIFNDNNWSAITRKGHIKLQLSSTTRLPLLAILKFQERDDSLQIFHTWIFATDIKVTKDTQAGTWRQLMAILNTTIQAQNENNSPRGF